MTVAHASAVKLLASNVQVPKMVSAFLANKQEQTKKSSSKKIFARLSAHPTTYQTKLFSVFLALDV